MTTTKPKIREIVKCKCEKCHKIVEIRFRELIRSTNKHIAIGLHSYHCKSCLHASEEYRSIHRNNSIAVIDVSSLSEQSKKLWQNPEYRQKMLENSRRLSDDKNFATKVSNAIATKFNTDKEYVDKIKRARLKYWDNKQYRADRTWSQDKFIAEARKLYADKYSYDKVCFANTREKVIITCKIHGDFEQRPSHHVFLENECPACARELRETKPQLEIANWLSELGFAVEVGDTKLLDGLEIDILVNGKFGIEYNGCFWHSYNALETTYQRNRHARKTDAAINKGINLFQITDI